MTPELIPFVLTIIFLYGIVIGSFLNVCIYRIPLKESVAKEHSHCMKCGYRLRWYDLIPIFSWIFLRGKCRKCGERISIQYPLVEACNGILYVAVFVINGYTLESVLYCFMASALLVLSVIDMRTYEIPFGINVFLFVIGVVHLLLDREEWLSYVAGFFAVSVLLEVILLVSKGRAIGGGDVKLMAAAGLILGWERILLAFIVGCVAGSVIHLLRMKISGADKVLAMGPYLSVGILFSALWGKQMITWYLNCLGM